MDIVQLNSGLWMCPLSTQFCQSCQVQIRGLTRSLTQSLGEFRDYSLNIRTLWIGLNNFQFVRSEIKKLTHCWDQGV